MTLMDLRDYPLQTEGENLDKGCALIELKISPKII